MGLVADGKTFKSPDYKLLPFFHRSRDGWRAKAEDRNLRIKRLKNRVAALEMPGDRRCSALGVAAERRPLGT